MRLYQITYTNKETSAHSYAWAGSQGEASSRRAELRKEHGHSNVHDTVEFDVPTKKPELLEFLNNHAGKL